jgi:hypothetical protein
LLKAINGLRCSSRKLPMNQSDRAALDAIAAQIAALTDHLSKLEYLTDPETVKALEGLVKAAPALTDLADGYRLAGKAGTFIKWFASVGAGLAALWAMVQIAIAGDPGK